MTKTKHTPGRSGARAKTAPRRYPCGCVAILTPDGPDWGACNVHHAAPELLEALRACVDQTCRGHCDRDSDWHCEECRTARDAIAKATAAPTHEQSANQVAVRAIFAAVAAQDAADEAATTAVAAANAAEAAAVVATAACKAAVAPAKVQP